MGDIAEDLHDWARRPETPTAMEAADLIRRFKELPGNEVGGSLHIVTDDENLTDNNLHFCYGFAAGRDDHVGVALALVLLRLSKTARLKAVRSA